MPLLTWDGTGNRYFETGVDRGVLYIYNGSTGEYDTGYAWNGLTTITETPTGGEATPMYADNVKYLNLLSTEELTGTIEAMTYPDAFAACDGSASIATGVSIGQQTRATFGLSYRTRIGNDIKGSDLGYKLHLVYGCLASPSERAFATVNDTPEAITFSWAFTTTPVPVSGYKNTSLITIDSTKIAPANLASLENTLYGGGASGFPLLPSPATVVSLLSATQTSVIATAPTFVAGTGVITIPTVTGVTYKRADTNVAVSGTVTIPTSGASLRIIAVPASSAYVLSAASDDDWVFTRT